MPLHEGGSCPYVTAGSGVERKETAWAGNKWWSAGSYVGNRKLSVRREAMTASGLLRLKSRRDWLNRGWMAMELEVKILRWHRLINVFICRLILRLEAPTRGSLKASTNPKR